MTKRDNLILTILIIYYLLLALVFMSWTNIDSVPGSIMRLAFLAALLAPAYFIENKILPAVMALFLSASTHGFTSSYMPAMMYTYVVILLGGLVLFHSNNLRDKIHDIRFLIIFLIYITLVNTTTTFEFQAISQALIISICILCYIDYEDERMLHIMSCAFMLASIMLSYSLLMWGKDFNSYDYYGEDRYGFQDINYSSCVVSLGCIAALAEIFYNSKNKIIFTISIATLIISIVALTLNASRASLLSIFVSFVILSLMSKTRSSYKILIIGLAAAGLWLLYTNNYFALLERRLEMDSGGGSGRTEIWGIKMDAFFNESNIIQLLFGWGYTEGRDLAMSRLFTTGFHNDFLAFIVEYGIIGGLMFIYVIFYPFLFALKNHNNFICIVAICAGFFIICSTLEPFAAGRVPYYFFWLYMLWWARIKHSDGQDIELQEK